MTAFKSLFVNRRPYKVFGYDTLVCHIPLIFSIGKKKFQLHATFLHFVLLYIKPIRLGLTAVIPSADVLIQQCLDGDSSAYRALYDRYSRAMFNTALRIVNRVPDAEDILQDAFTDAFMKLKDFENKSTFGAWLKQIVVYKSLNFLRRQRTSLIDIDNIGDTADENEDDESVWYTVDTIKQTMQDLPDGYRTVLSLHLFEGYDHEEIAEILKVAQSTVRTQYIRARQKLLNLLKVKAANEQ